MWGEVYLFHKFPNDAVPFLGFRVVNAIHMIGDQSYGILEPDLTCDPLQQIDAEPLEPCVSR